MNLTNILTDYSFLKSLFMRKCVSRGGSSAESLRWSVKYLLIYFIREIKNSAYSDFYVHELFPLHFIILLDRLQQLNSANSS